ncbi:MAG: hypothetical protein RXQ77_03240 [Candidatus Nanopusillus sp.]
MNDQTKYSIKTTIKEILNNISNRIGIKIDNPTESSIKENVISLERILEKLSIDIREKSRLGDLARHAYISIFSDYRREVIGLDNSNKYISKPYYTEFEIDFFQTYEDKHSLIGCYSEMGEREFEVPSYLIQCHNIRKHKIFTVQLPLKDITNIFRELFSNLYPKPADDLETFIVDIDAHISLNTRESYPPRIKIKKYRKKAKTIEVYLTFPTEPPYRPIIKMGKPHKSESTDEYTEIDYDNNKSYIHIYSHYSP